MESGSTSSAAYEDLSFFVLGGLPTESEIGVDGRVWQVKRCNGFKILPPGLHLFVFSASPTSKSADSSGGIAVRHGILRFYGNKETIVEEWNNSSEELTVPSYERQISASSEQTSDVVSIDYLKTIDNALAPYPQEAQSSWIKLTRYITRETVARVVGFDSRGVACLDATVGTLDDEKEMQGAQSHMMWGKPRPEQEQQKKNMGILRFVTLQLQKSWPEGAVGSRLSLWSIDKSWMLDNAVKNQLGNDFQQLLAELQLSFILFSFLHSFSSFSTYKSIFASICRSHTLMLPPTSFSIARATTNDTTDSVGYEYLPVCATFVSIVHDQLASLDNDFFTQHLPTAEEFFLEELSNFRRGFVDASAEWIKLETTPAGVVWKEFLNRWDSLHSSTMEKFGWDLGTIPRHIYQGSNRDEGHIDIEDLEEGEDAPVIVEI